MVAAFNPQCSVPHFEILKRVEQDGYLIMPLWACSELSVVQCPGVSDSRVSCTVYKYHQMRCYPAPHPHWIHH